MRHRNNGNVASNKRLELYTMQIRVCRLTITLLAVVSCCATARAQQSGMVNIRPRVASVQSGVPAVRVTVDRNRVPVGADVTFTLTPASIVRNPQFTVTIYFGDGAQQEMHQTAIVHPYRAPGTYTYSVLVEPSPTPIASPTPSPSPRPPISVKLIANPTTVTTGDPVAFIAQLSRNYPNIQYRFVFADGAQTDWQNAPQTSHTYAAAKTYLAFVDIRDGRAGSTLGGSPRQPIQVTAPQNVRVDLLANPASVKTGDTVRFNAQTNSGDPNIKYRFAFGDGAITGWLDSPSTNHKYAVARDYFASVEVGLPSGPGIKTVATSKPAMIGVAAGPNPNPSPSPRASPTSSTSPRPTPNASPSAGTPSPSRGQTNSASPVATPSTSPTPTLGGPFESSDNWWKYLLLALLVLFLAYKTARYLLLPRPQFVPNLDPGASRVGAGKALSIDLQLALDPNVTGGQYGIETHEGSLIKSERGSNG